MTWHTSPTYHSCNRFNSGVQHNSRTLRWDTVIEQKTMELARYLTGKSHCFDFSESSPDFAKFGRLDNRKRILNLSQSEALRLGIGKGTLHYLRKRARSHQSFRADESVQETSPARCFKFQRTGVTQ